MTGNILKPHDYDILFGRGNAINKHPGNEILRQLAARKREDYKNAFYREQRNQIAEEILNQIQNLSPPGRFLKQEENTGPWYEVGNRDVILKICQVLRERPKKQSLETSENVASKDVIIESTTSMSTPQQCSVEAFDSYRKMNEIEIPSLITSHENTPAYETKEAQNIEFNTTFNPYFMANLTKSYGSPQHVKYMTSLSNLYGSPYPVQNSITSALKSRPNLQNSFLKNNKEIHEGESNASHNVATFDKNCLKSNIVAMNQGLETRIHHIRHEKYSKEINKNKRNPLSKKKLWGCPPSLRSDEDVGEVPDIDASSSDDSDVQDSEKEINDESLKENCIASASSFFFSKSQETEKKSYSSVSSIQDSTIEGNGKKRDKKRSIQSTEAESNKRSKGSDIQEIIYSLSLIAESFISNPMFSDRTKCVFKDIVDMKEKEEAMACLPSAMTGLFIRILELEKEAQNK